MRSDPCTVCGSTELNLVDGYYYCVECGTQDVNVQHTVVEETVLADGTFAFSRKRKVHKILKDKVKMSSEWYKWHAFNFILSGLTEELLALGAKETVKKKIFWIWTKYILKYQDKEEQKNAQKSEDSDTEVVNGMTHKDCAPDNGVEKGKYTRNNKIRADVDVLTHGVILAIIYVGLNMDRSDIQLSDLYRFIAEGRLSFLDCTKFVPKEIDVKAIPRWKSFLHGSSVNSRASVQTLAQSLCKRLDLGLPVVPDLTKLFDKYIKELCLSLDFRDFVLSLTHLLPLDFLQRDISYKTFPDYECVCMAYILLGLKILFGLDSDYEIKLSDVVENINEKENYLKSYKLGFVSEPTGRLFSFREWCSFIKFRKIVMCKNLLSMAKMYNYSADDNLLMVHLYEKKSKKPLLRQEIAMNILNRITHSEDFEIIPKNEFPATITPLSTYTDIILDHIQDPDLRLMLCEDFSHYSMKYATEMTGFTDYEGDFIVGVSNSQKTISSKIYGNFNNTDVKGKNLVFVRNCENENWFETKQPNLNHITTVSENDAINKENVFEDNSEITSPKIMEVQDKLAAENSMAENKECKFEGFEEESEEISIFDDDFKDCFNYVGIENNDTKIKNNDIKIEYDDRNSDCNDRNIDNEVLFVFHNPSLNNDISTNLSYSEVDSDHEYIDPENIDRPNLIQLLIDYVCKVYKITKPSVRTVKTPSKRKSNMSAKEAGVIKRRKYEKVDSKYSVNSLVSSYYEFMGKDVINQVSEQVNSIIQNIESIDNHCDTIDNTAESKLEESNLEVNRLENRNLEESELQPENCPGNNSIHDVTDNNKMDNDSDHSSDTQDSEDEIEAIVHKYNPEFDKETHDIKQLYVKVEENLFEEGNYLEMNDPVLMKFVDKKILEIRNLRNIEKEKELSDSDDDLPLSVLQGRQRIHCIRQKKEKELSDSGDEISVLQERKRIHCIRKKNHNGKFEPLINNFRQNKSYNIWHKTYCAIRKYQDLTERFDRELKENYPESFAFVTEECAALINCTSYKLFKELWSLEKKLLSLNEDCDITRTKRKRSKK